MAHLILDFPQGFGTPHQQLYALFVVVIAALSRNRTMVVLQGFRATVAVDGRGLPEYADDAEDSDYTYDGPQPLESLTITRYIEATSDANFNINIATLPDWQGETKRGAGVTCRIYLDAIEVYSGCLTGLPLKKSFSHCNPFRDKAGNWLQQAFRFAEIQIGEYKTLYSSEILIGSQTLSQSYRHLK